MIVSHVEQSDSCLYVYIYVSISFLSIFVLLLWMGGFTEFQPFPFISRVWKLLILHFFANFFFIDFMENGIFEGFYSTIFASNLAFTYFFSAPYLSPSTITIILDCYIFPYTSLRHCSYFSSILSVSGLGLIVSFVMSLGSIAYFLSFLSLSPDNKFSFQYCILRLLELNFLSLF